MSSERSSQSSFYSQHVMGEHDKEPPLMHTAQSRLMRRDRDHDKPRRILDIGSGAGVGAALISRTLGAEEVICIDLSVGALQEVRKAGFAPLIASAEGHRLPFPDASFDVVILDEVIEHLVDTDSIMDEIHRVLRADGQLLISTPNLASWFNRISLLLGVQPAFSEVSFRKVYGRPGSGLVGHLRLFTKRAFVAFVNDKGFTVDKIAGIPFPELPGFVRPVDALLSRIPSIAGGVVIVANRNP